MCILKESGGTGPPKPHLGARRTSYRHCRSGHAKGTRAIELPESLETSGCKRGPTFSIILKIKDLQNRTPLNKAGLRLRSSLQKAGGEKPYHQVRTPFPSELAKRVNLAGTRSGSAGFRAGTGQKPWERIVTRRLSTAFSTNRRKRQLWLDQRCSSHGPFLHNPVFPGGVGLSLCTSQLRSTFRSPLPRPLGPQV